MIKLGLILLMLLTGCTQAQPELRETKEVQTSIPYSDEELIKNANNQIDDEEYYVDSITMQSDSEVWFSLKNKDLNKQYVFKYEANYIKFKYFFLLIYNRVVDKMKVVYPFYESVIIKKPKKVNV